MSSSTPRRAEPWPGAWRHFEPSSNLDRGWPGYPYCHTRPPTHMTVADVHDLARTAGPIVALNEWQSGRCALCGGDVPFHCVVADHEHATGWVRGLICFSCNALDAHGAGRVRLPLQAEALSRYLDHPVTDLLGLRIQYGDTQQWKGACDAYHDAQVAQVRAQLTR